MKKNLLALGVVLLCVFLGAAHRAEQLPAENSYPQRSTSVPMLSSLRGDDGIRPLTPVTFAAAVDLGTKAKTTYPLMSVFAIRQWRLNDPDRMLGPDERARVQAQIEKGPFKIEIITPYIKVFNAAAEAARRFETFVGPTADVANAEGVWIAVAPGPQLLSGDAVDNVVLKRGDAVIRPAQRVVEPYEAKTAMNATRQLTTGRFQFNFEAFNPSEPVTIVVVGATQNLEWILEVAELKKLR